MVYPTLLLLMRTPRLPVVGRTDAPADLNGFVRFTERQNLVSSHVPSHFKRSLPTYQSTEHHTPEDHILLWFILGPSVSVTSVCGRMTTGDELERI